MSLVQMCLLSATAAIAVTGCNPDIFDVQVALGSTQLPVDFGTAQGTIPVVPCTTQDVTVCGMGRDQAIQLTNGAGEASVSMACDATLARCYAQVAAQVNYTVDVLQDASFTSKVGRHAISVVRMLDVALTIPTNTTTFDIPQVDIFVGPGGAMSANDSGVYPVDSLGKVPAGITVSSESPRHLTLEDGSQARDLIESSIKNKQPFVFIIGLAPRMESGAALPAGHLDVDVQAMVGLGLR